jgi:hypothetical protein
MQHGLQVEAVDEVTPALLPGRDVGLQVVESASVGAVKGDSGRHRCQPKHKRQRIEAQDAEEKRGEQNDAADNQSARADQDLATAISRLLQALDLRLEILDLLARVVDNETNASAHACP